MFEILKYVVKYFLMKTVLFCFVTGILTLSFSLKFISQIIYIFQIFKFYVFNFFKKSTIWGFGTSDRTTTIGF